MLVGTAAKLQRIGVEGTLRDQEIALEDALERTVRGLGLEQQLQRLTAGKRAPAINLKAQRLLLGENETVDANVNALDLDAHLSIDGGDHGGANGLGEFLERIAKEHHDTHGECELVADDLGLDRRLRSRGLGREHHGDKVGGKVLDANGGDALDIGHGARDDGGQNIGRNADAVNLDFLGHESS
ncbi:hypothetical protein COLAER_00068 [Collinsella aerofaciens ATCC 25986]|uniref:Uncharacterized protein n=1 Tax=Collinsella aerofaciens (strain ATCC 25986 / DSM 3979 / JCM 10188 / KCTC 3647 / NCTC 11838 / VPI 1003) TaxID=411903 RepID=A4E6P3_COLAA|nr:hypothetical protein COLAER_00068 [Collinsella aerofaciens ATCC 25986]